MAAKGGGSWKVAYADFVTAMMAFFLVMWITAQDQKVKSAIANYFNDPSGTSIRPTEAGALFQSPNHGTAPATGSMALGTGEKTFTCPVDKYATKLVSDWLHHDQQRHQYWRSQAQLHLESAAQTARLADEGRTEEEIAADQLARQLKDEISRAAPAPAEGLYADLLDEVLMEVNWRELAADFLWNR
jgi:flagellar motor protein MotB